ncbi:uncharacterized protein B0H18DRAFT_1088099 [Fomitopsis serialis]|uniref:uncharacterized protein n=1 Tax=Fomitopsis serialis TaxID=139415 RepID=UPI002007C497|nr:uncharacterized protein B0H18DRAFT_1088099 [Neoantrodia serialis]KAH9913359.1 hypothetical protein B0H18DRAFT_1088099 [Neoantrodia serialis]
MSPYTIPSDAWAQYEKKTQASGMPAIHTSGSEQIVDIVIHPRDLNLLFVAYGGMIVDILLPRRPPVTALTIHPSGHVLAVGHADGTIAFWALEDEDHPLYVRTLDEEEDVFAVDVTKLEAALPSGDSSGAKERLAEIREPIFKLAWSGFPNSSDPRGGDTVLTVLGGLGPDSSPGLTAFLLPPLNSPAPPDATTAKMPSQPPLHPDVRAAMQEILFPLDSHTYHTPGAVQDFLLIPRSSPHFSGTWDPCAVLLLSDSALDTTGVTRVVDAYEFPPPAFVASLMKPAMPGAADLDDPSVALSQELATTLESMALSADPRQLRLPWAFSTVDGSMLFKIDKEAYGRLMEESLDDALPIKGGKAWVEDTEGQMKLMKFQPHHILVTHDHDLVIRFQDLSAQLLTSSSDSPVQSSFPNALSALTIELGPLLHDPSLRLSALPSSAESIHSAQSVHSSHSVQSPHSPASPAFSGSGETSAVSHDPSAVQSIHLAPESLECVAVLNNGTVILNQLDAEGTSSPSEISDEELVSLTHVPVRSKLRYRPYLGVRAGWGQVSACGVSDIDPTPRIRLIATTSSGSASIYTVTRSSSGAFAIPDPPTPVDAASHTLSSGSFVVDAKSGARVAADRQGLSTVLEASGAEGAGRRCVWVSAGMKGGCALVAFTDRGEALVYSLPFLEYLHTLQLPETSLSHVSADSTGDYLTHIVDPTTRIVRQTIYGTLFATRRAAPYAAPLVDFMVGHGAVPSQPAPVPLEPQTVIGSVLGYLGRGVTTGVEIDMLLAGPDRPEPPKSIYDPTGRVPAASRDGKAKDVDQGGATASSVKAASAQMSSGALGNLEEQFNSLEQGSKSMVAQHAEEAVLARRLAFMFPFLGVLRDQVLELTVWCHMQCGVPSAQYMWCRSGAEYLRGRACGVAVVRDVLVHEDGALRDRWRVLEDTELRMARWMTDLDETVELSTNRLYTFGNADGVVEDSIFCVDLVGFLYSR